MQARTGAVSRMAGWVRAHWRLLLGLAVSAASLYYLLRTVDPTHLWETFRRANYLYFLPAALLLVGINIARALRVASYAIPADAVQTVIAEWLGRRGKSAWAPRRR